jgi:hypothetical protein
MICIIGAITYIFVAGPKARFGQADVALNRHQEVWDCIGRLEARRRDMLVRAEGRGVGLLPPARAAKGGAWADGYRTGFARGYSLGSANAGSGQGNPLFFALGAN